MKIREIFEAIIGNKSNGYVALKVQPDSVEQIRKAVIDVGINPKSLINKMHLTLMYDESEPTIPMPKNTMVHQAKIDDISTLGDPESRWFAVVLKLNSDSLHRRFKELQELGYKHSYDTFVPHVSVIYGPSKEEADLIISRKADIMNAIGVIELGEEYSEGINKPDPDTA